MFPVEPLQWYFKLAHEMERQVGRNMFFHVMFGVRYCAPTLQELAK